MFDELWSEINDAQGEIYDVIEYKEEWEKEDKFDVEKYINGDTDYWGKCYPGQPPVVGRQSGTRSVAIRSILCKYRTMNKTQLFSPQNLQDLQDFMFDTMASSEMAVDWFCDRFNVNADDDVIDFVLDAHDAFFGNW